MTSRKTNKLFVWVGSLLGSGLGLATGALLFFVWITGKVLEGDAAVFDQSIRSYVHGFATDNLTVLMNVVTVCGSTLFLSAVAIVVIPLLIWRGHKHSAAVLTVTMAGAFVLNFALKVMVMRDRPIPYFDTPLPASYSFPSGHALYSFCFYGSLAWIFAAHIHNRARQVSMWAFAALLILLIGLSRVYLGVHYPSDVLAGYVAAFVWVFTVFAADTMVNRARL